MCRHTHSCWAHEYSGPAMCRGHCLALVFSDLWLLSSFCLHFFRGPEPWERDVMEMFHSGQSAPPTLTLCTPTSSKPPPISPTCCIKRLLWRGLRAAQEPQAVRDRLNFFTMAEAERDIRASGADARGTHYWRVDQGGKPREVLSVRPKI